MKKKFKKLTLSTETLRSLGDRPLEDAAGGATGATNACTLCTIKCSACTIACSVCHLC